MAMDKALVGRALLSTRHLNKQIRIASILIVQRRLMPHYGTLRETKLQQDADDLRGAEVYGVNDEKLGKVDDVIFDHSSGDIKYVVVETGGLFSKKSFLLPAN